MRPSLIKTAGFVFLSEFYPDVTTLAIAESLGRIITIPDVPAVQSICPRSKDVTQPNIYSGNYGLEPFPLHTDLAHWYLPPRYMLLRCIHPAKQVFTTLLHHESALAGISSLTIRRALYRPRRRLNGQLALLRLIQPISALLMFRWDQLFLSSVNDEAIEASNHLRSIQSEKVDSQIVFENPGDTLLVDNWTMLHGRSAVPEEGVNRKIERVYLEEVRA